MIEAVGNGSRRAGFVPVFRNGFGGVTILKGPFRREDGGIVDSEHGGEAGCVDLGVSAPAFDIVFHSVVEERAPEEVEEGRFDGLRDARLEVEEVEVGLMGDGLPRGGGHGG